MFSKKQQDLDMGFKNEEEVIDLVRSLPFCSDLENISKNVNRFSVIDCRGKEATAEIKSRRINHDKYATALIGANKIHDFNNNNLHNYIVWKYEDGLFYLKYDKDNWNYNKKIQRVYRDGTYEDSLVYEIPYQVLIKI